jgi:hypothetical protein
MEVKVSPFGETLSRAGIWRYPEQMNWPSAGATTTLLLATVGEDVTGEAASYSQAFLPLGESEPVDAAVVGADKSTRARVANVQSGLPHPDYRVRRPALNRVTADVADRV